MLLKFFQSIIFISITYHPKLLKAEEYVIAGSSPRTERESKIAFIRRRGTSPVAKLRTGLRNIAESLINTHRLSLPKLLDKPYRIEGKFTDFVFDDTYFDTSDRQILKNRSAYRLRYRFSEMGSYIYFLSGLPYLGKGSSTGPNRVEVQFKKSYQFDSREGLMKVEESRFEFRNESEPFLRNNDAPKPPWPREQFIDYAIKGTFRTYEMMPHAELQKQLGSPSPLLHPILRVITQRHRMHINIESPWGSGPNPEQAFIITIDVSRVGDQDSELLEIEVETDRNISRNMDLTLRYANLHLPYGEKVRDAAVAFTHKGAKALAADHKHLSEAIYTEVSKRLGQAPLEPDYKYSRLSRLARTKT